MSPACALFLHHDLLALAIPVGRLAAVHSRDSLPVPLELPLHPHELGLLPIQCKLRLEQCGQARGQIYPQIRVRARDRLTVRTRRQRSGPKKRSVRPNSCPSGRARPGGYLALGQFRQGIELAESLGRPLLPCGGQVRVVHVVAGRGGHEGREVEGLGRVKVWQRRGLDGRG
jgi:hypothetical protein